MVPLAAWFGPTLVGPSPRVVGVSSAIVCRLLRFCLRCRSRALGRGHQAVFVLALVPRGAADGAVHIRIDATAEKGGSSSGCGISCFDEMMDQKTEQMRETNALRDVQMEQRKADNQVTKKFIQSINE